MNRLISSIFATAFSGIGGTCVGALCAIAICVAFRKRFSSVENIVKALMGFAGGVMLCVICFDLIPDAYSYSGFFISFVSLMIGCTIVPICDVIARRASIIKPSRDKYSRLGAIMFFSIAMHNLPEGIAVGAGFFSSSIYGLQLAFVIALHNVPEGMALAIPMIAARKSAPKVLALAALSGVSTIIGGGIGWYVSGISKFFIGGCLGFAAGAMLYVVIGQIFPVSYEENKENKVIVFIILGFFAGLLLTN